MKLYRVEDKKGRGPYRWDGVIRYPFTDGLPEHPNAWADGLPEPEYRVKFAFRSMALLRKWFDETRRAWLRQHGFIIRVYEAPENAIYSSEHQSIFDAERATQLEEIAI